MLHYLGLLYGSPICFFGLTPRTFEDHHYLIHSCMLVCWIITHAEGAMSTLKHMKFH